MVTLRSLVFFAILILAVIAYALAIMVSSRWMSRDRLQGLSRSWSRFLLRTLRLVCGLDYRICGLENLPDGPCILLSKHQSAWETIALPGVIPKLQVWVLKQELMQIPFFGWALRAFDPIAIDRSAGRKAMRQLLAEGKQHLDAGRSILVFPEGTRVAVGQRKAFTIGGAILAERNQVPIVPIAHNAGVFWARRGVRKRPGCIQVVIGPPIAAEGRSAQTLNALSEEWINSTVESLPQQAGD
ncbi:1-acyl-sn-glycerol-3-phosphate acyltransferase [Thiohalocapsa marina]|uniref:1-acyl-sn-glycerol-3-phosphate acyltransferase n=1 Tax=Thiohalocapsa marina TaxID=424902 RepID=A0A5M8FTW6_9GAMM|nr:lysophospholipid acyltransferase family protein [Thiohalocapsa marina]KAA6187254.1 1-acyl-sn-glycerol-3-phosphate acyltransferase [Thiohalocapsa marina]